MQDVKLTCANKSCGKEFVWPVHEQQFFAKQGFTAPKRCRACRAQRRKEQEVKRTPAEPKDKEWGTCESCGQFQPLTSVGMCGPCTFGEADTINGNW